MPALLRTHLDLPKCPLCGVNSPNLGYLSDSAVSDYLGQVRTWAVYRCNKCAGLVTARADGINAEIYFHHPRANEPLSADIPERSRDYLTQAMDSAGSPAGAVVMAASAVDSMLQNKNYATGTLNEKINAAVGDHLITQDMAEWAHNLRLDANAQRHPDLAAALPTSEDAQRSIDFALALGEIMFVLPARVTHGKTQ